MLIRALRQANDKNLLELQPSQNRPRTKLAKSLTPSVALKISDFPSWVFDKAGRVYRTLEVMWSRAELDIKRRIEIDRENASTASRRSLPRLWPAYITNKCLAIEGALSLYEVRNVSSRIEDKVSLRTTRTLLGNHKHSTRPCGQQTPLVVIHWVQ